MLGIRSTNIPKSSGNQIAWGQCGAMRISSPVVAELVVGMRMPTVPSSSLTEHLLPWQMDLERGTQIVEVCDSTLLQTDPIIGFPIPVSVLGRQMGAETILYLTSGKGATVCLQGCSISQGCVVPEALFGWLDCVMPEALFGWPDT